MAATNGDAAALVATTLGSVNLPDQRAEVHAVDISTDGSGDGSSTVTYDEAFADATVFPLVTGDEGADWFVSSAGASQATVNVEGATADGTVTAYALFVGKDGSR